MSDLVPWMMPWSGRLLTLAGVLVGLFIFGYALFGYGRSRGRPRCPKCRYDLTALGSDRCPECGRDVSDPRSRHRTQRYWTVAFFGLLLAAALPAFVVHRRVSVYGWRYYTYVGPVYWLWPERVDDSLRVGDYLVQVWSDRRGDESDRVTIRHAGNEILEREAWRWSIGGNSEYGLPRTTDLNANGKMEVVLTEWSGGAHDMGPTQFVELDGDRAVIIETLERSGSLTDQDGDGVPEVHVLDQQFNYWHSSYAGSPMQSVVLKWGGDRLVPDASRMLRPPVPESELTVRASQLRESLARTGSLENHSGLWDTMLDLIYSGHSARAYRFLDEAWPENLPGKAQFIIEFRERLASSRFADFLVEIGHPPFPSKASTRTSAH